VTLVIDASIALKWFLVEPDSAIAQNHIRHDGALVAPDLIMAEFANVIWLRRRQGAMTRPQAVQAMGDLAAILVLASTEGLALQAYRLAEEFDHPVYDCFYFALAEREGAVHVTADKRFVERVRAARPKAPIALLGEPLP
jgi:predicted nucleic acid-binding protein